MKKLFLALGIIVVLLLSACSEQKIQPQISSDQTDISTSAQEPNALIENEFPMNEQESRTKENNNPGGQPIAEESNSIKHVESPVYAGEENEISVQQSSGGAQASTNTNSSTIRPSTNVSSTTELSNSATVTLDPTGSAPPSQQIPAQGTDPILPEQSILEAGYTGSLAGEEDSDF